MDLRELRNAHQELIIQIQKQKLKLIVLHVHQAIIAKVLIFLNLQVNAQQATIVHQGQQLASKFQLIQVTIHLKELVLKLYVTMATTTHLLLNLLVWNVKPVSIVMNKECQITSKIAQEVIIALKELKIQSNAQMELI